MPLGLIWQQQLAQGVSLTDIAARWPDLTVDEIARIVDVATRRYRASANQRN